MGYAMPALKYHSSGGGSSENVTTCFQTRSGVAAISIEERTSKTSGLAVLSNPHIPAPRGRSASIEVPLAIVRLLVGPYASQPPNGPRGKGGGRANAIPMNPPRPNAKNGRLAIRFATIPAVAAF